VSAFSLLVAKGQGDSSSMIKRSMILGAGGESSFVTVLRLKNLLEAPVGEIPSNMVAPLLGSIYDTSGTRHSSK